jgi:hypothetical protein
MKDKPQTPADSRPNGVPYYIDNTCPDCGTELDLWDRWHPKNGEFWHDEWVCPNCLNECFIDWPEYDRFVVGGAHQNI